jgi:uncharacterized membrane protein
MKLEDKAIAPSTGTVDQNRSIWLYVVAVILSLVGIADSIYLTVMHLTGKSVRCSVEFACSEVLSSEYASIAGIPLASIGAVAYFTVFSLATLAAFGYKRLFFPLMILVLTMFAITLWLIYLQAFVINAWCQYCLLSAFITTCLTCLVLIKYFLLRHQL